MLILVYKNVVGKGVGPDIFEGEPGPLQELPVWRRRQCFRQTPNGRPESTRFRRRGRFSVYQVKPGSPG